MSVHVANQRLFADRIFLAHAARLRQTSFFARWKFRGFLHAFKPKSAAHSKSNAFVWWCGRLCHPPRAAFRQACFVASEAEACGCPETRETDSSSKLLKFTEAMTSYEPDCTRRQAEIDLGCFFFGHLTGNKHPISSRSALCPTVRQTSLVG